MKKRMLSLLLAVCLVVSMAPAAFAANGTTTAADTEKATIATDKGAKLYSDVPENSWFYESVDTVTKNGYFNGYPDGTFKPAESMTRAMFVTVISRMAEAKTDNSVTKFPDVPVNTWYTGAVTWANENGIVLGRSDTVFDPNTAITRIEMCIIMSRYVKYLAAETGKTIKATEEAKTFTDTKDLSESYLDALNNCVAYGLIQGYADGTFRPNSGATRAEVATVATRFAAKLEEKKPDTSGGSYWTPTTPEQTDFTVTYAMPETSDYDYQVTVTKAAEGDTTHPVLDWATYAENSKATEPTQQAFADWTDGTNKYTAGDVITLTDNVKLTAEFVSTEDEIFLALQAAETSAKNWYTTKHEAVEKAETTAPKVLHYGDIVLSHVSVTGDVKDPPEKTRDIIVEGTATIEGLTIEEKIVEIAANVAKGALGETATSTSEYRAQLTQLVKDVAAAIGVQNIDTSSVRNIVDSLYTWGNDEIHEILKGCGIAEAISSMTVTVGGQSATINVDAKNHGLTLASGDKKTVAKNLGVALAKTLYASAKETKSYSSTVDLNADITLKFVPAEDKATKLDDYPTSYKVNVKLTLSAKDDVLQYRYDAATETNYIKAYIPTSVQDKYTDEIGKIVEDVMKGDALTSQIDGVKDTITQTTSFGQLINAIDKFDESLDSDGAKAEVEEIVDDWINANLSTDLTKNVLYKHYWVPETAASTFTASELDNTAFYGTSATDAGLIGTVAGSAATYFEGKIADVKQDAINKAIAKATDEAKKECADHGITDQGLIDQAVAQAVAEAEDYAGRLIDSLVNETLFNTGGVKTTPANFDTALRQVGEGISNIDISMLENMDSRMKYFVYAAIIDSHWRNDVEKTNRYVDMKAYLDETILSQINSKLAPATPVPGAAGKPDIGTTLTDLSKLKSIDSISKLTIEELFTALDNVSSLTSSSGEQPGPGTPPAQTLVEKYGQTIINYIQKGANALANRDVTVKVTLGENGPYTLDHDDFVRIAGDTANKGFIMFLNHLYTGMEIANLKLADFVDGYCIITVTSGNNEVTVCPVFELQQPEE